MVSAGQYSHMSDRSDEVTTSRDPKSTDELLEETEDLLSGSSGSSSSSARRDDRSTPAGEFEPDDEPAGEATESGSRWPSFGSDDDAVDPESDSTSSGSKLSSITSLFSPSRLSPTNYFSPKAYLALVAVISAGVIAGSTVLPFAGRMIGMFLTAFLIGLIASKRRYLEMGAAGASVGIIAAMFNFTILVSIGFTQGVLAVGTTTGALACLVGYYFGRDLKSGLSRDID